MSDYTYTTDFGSKDALPTGNAAKVVKGSEFDTEFNALATAIATKYDSGDSPTFNNITITGAVETGTLDGGTF